MVIRKFLLVLETSKGSVFVSVVTYTASELPDALERYVALGAKLVDIVSVDIDLAKYEH